MRSPSRRQAHVGEGDFGEVVEEREEAVAPSARVGDFPQPVPAYRELIADAIVGNQRGGVPERELVRRGRGGLYTEDAVPDARVVRAGVAQGEESFQPGEEELVIRGMLQRMVRHCGYLSEDVLRSSAGAKSGSRKR